MNGLFGNTYFELFKISFKKSLVLQATIPFICLSFFIGILIYTTSIFGSVPDNSELKTAHSQYHASIANNREPIIYQLFPINGSSAVNKSDDVYELDQKNFQNISTGNYTGGSKISL